MQPATIVIDGGCGLCARASRFGMRHARHGLLRFVASQSPEGEAALDRHGLRADAADTMVAIVGGRAHVRSAAVVEVARRLRWPWRAQAALWLVPRPVRDAAYRWVARRRHRPGRRP